MAVHTKLSKNFNLSTKNSTATRTIGRSLDVQGRMSVLVHKHYKMLLPFGLFIALYLTVTFMAPNSAAMYKYRLSNAGALLLTISVALPYVAIWLVALIGYLRLKDYAEGIKASKDGRALHIVSIGILCLTFWLPLSAASAVVVRNVYHAHPGWTPLAVYADNYSSLLITFLAVALIYRGSRRLLAIARVPEQVLPAGVAAFVAFAGLYVFLVLQDPARQIPVTNMQAAIYYLPDWLTVLSIVVPRLLIWYFGFQAAYNIFVYRMNVKGKIYRASLNSLAFGIAVVVAAIAVLRIVQTLTVWLGHWNLAAVVLLVYALLVLVALGYILIARGAWNLQRIEKV